MLRVGVRAEVSIGCRGQADRQERAHMDADSRTESSKKNVRFLRESWRVSSMYGLKSPLRAVSG